MQLQENYFTRMVGLLPIYILFNLPFILIKCNLSDELRVRKTDQKLIEKQRQDTRDMCKIFNSEAQNDSLPKKPLPVDKYNKRKKELKIKQKKEVIQNKKARRIKRAVDSVNPALNVEDELRVESIVDKIYDDLLEKGQKIAYRRKEIPTPMTTPKNNSKGHTPKVKSGRRFPFAPNLIEGGVVFSSTSKVDTVIEELAGSHPVRFEHSIVPYFIDAKTYDIHLAEIITKAFDYFEKATCIRMQRLRERPTDQNSILNVSWLYISNPSGIRQCVHSNDMLTIQGVQLITLGYDCMSLGDIAHEIMHVLGFAHEHVRPDRDQHITVLWENIKPGYKQYFEIKNENIVEGLPYDYASVMHYPPRAFSRNGKPTILTERGIKIGQREALSEMDLEKISIVYSNECIKRNREYLLKTCPAVVKAALPTTRIFPEGINEYFKDRIWPYGVVKYKFDTIGIFTFEEKENIKTVMNHISNQTCVQFVDISQTDTLDVQDDKENENEINDENDSAGSYQFDTEELDNLIVLSDSNSYSDYNLEDDADEYNYENDDGILPVSSTSKEADPSLRFEINSNRIGDSDKTARKGVKTINKNGTKGNFVKKINSKYKINRKDANIGANGNIPNIGANSKVKTIVATRKQTARRKVKSRRDLEETDFDGSLVLTRSNEPGCPCPHIGKPVDIINSKLNIHIDCFNTVNDLLHLFGHVLGLDHQHNMHDRDSYLYIPWDELTEDVHQEMKTKLKPEASVGYPYDYHSVMHYPWMQIKNGVTNMMYPIWNDGWSMGHWQGLSAIDVEKIQRIYKQSCLDRDAQKNEENKNTYENKEQENTDKNEEPENADEYEEPEKTDEYKEPEKTDEHKEPENSDEYEEPEKTDEYKEPEKIDEYEEPEKTDESKEPEKTDEYEEPEKIDEYEEPEKTDEYEEPEKIDEYEEPEKIDEYEEPEKTDDNKENEKKDENEENKSQLSRF